ncbi:MAG: hypothetical protein M1840_007204 [Geoglossum simile]|nr:MAG: hypothetical protein M1840_007204 [Geoglossum simile]
MGIQIITLQQGEGPDTPDNGDIVIADVEIWDLDCNNSDNHNKGKAICNWESFKFQVGESFVGENQRFNFLHKQVRDMFVNAQTRLTQSR